jgi:hypothetical protein
MAKRPAAKETDLAAPVRDLLVGLGYTVRSEVLDCDLVAVRGDEVVAIELKTGLTATLLIQAVLRQQSCDAVYVAIPRPTTGERGLDWRGAKLLLKRLALGLITVALDSPARGVEVVLDPQDWRHARQPRQRARIVREVAGRSADHNLAGGVRRKLVTAYREASIRAAVYLDRLGPSAAKDLVALGCRADTRTLLYDDHYGWFERLGKGRYAITAKGRAELAAYPELVARYAALAQPPVQPGASAHTA